jgi:hypothetical protein
MEPWQKTKYLLNGYRLGGFVNYTLTRGLINYSDYSGSVDLEQNLKRFYSHSLRKLLALPSLRRVGYVQDFQDKALLLAESRSIAVTFN